MQPTYRLVMFGGLTLLRDGAPVSGTLAQRKRLILLGLLAASPNGLARETALAMLWPDSDDERARNSLSQLLHGLRREIDDGAIRASNGVLALDSDLVASDVAAFRSAMARGDHEAAVALYHGPFLDAVHLRESSAFEHWCDGQRAEFANLYMSSLQWLADDAKRRDDRFAAVQWWKRCASADPTSSRIAHSYMKALVADDKREEAIRHAEVHAEILRVELEAEPDADVVLFASELRKAGESMRRVPDGLERDRSNATVPSASDAGTVASEGERVIRVPLRRSARVRGLLTPRRLGFGAVALSAVVLASVLWPSGQALDDRRVVVAAFENRTGDEALDALGFMAADWVAQGLQRTSLTEVVDPATASLASRYARSERIPLGDAREVRLMASETRARLVVTGTYYRDRDTLVVVSRISDARDGKLLDAPPPVRVPLATPVAAVEPIRERVLGALAMRLDTRLDVIVPPGTSPPPTYAAYRDYMEGLAAFQVQDRRTAVHYLSRASAADSTFALPLIWMVWATGNLSANGDSTARRLGESAVRRLESMRDQLAPLDRLAVDLQQASARADLRAKVAAAREASRLAPGSHWTHNFGSTLIDMGRFDEAIAAYESIDRGKGWTRGWVRFWERFTVALHLAGDHARELAIAREARRALPAAPLPVYLEARALAALGRVAALNQAIKDLEAYKENADSLGVWISLLAREVETSGDTLAATLLHDRAVSWFATLPPEDLAKSTRQLQLGIALYRGGRYAEARPIFATLVADTSRNVRSANFDPQGYLGGVYAYLGDRARADSIIDVLLSDRRGAGNYALNWSARIAAAMGDRERAVGYLRRLVALTGRGMGVHYDNRDLDGLMDYPPYQALVEASDTPTRPVVAARGRTRR
jgi:DNA-binding SARP family transcriptional activator/TolB-like protein